VFADEELNLSVEGGGCVDNMDGGSVFGDDTARREHAHDMLPRQPDDPKALLSASPTADEDEWFHNSNPDVYHKLCDGCGLALMHP
jgi:hypothetical protein